MQEIGSSDDENWREKEASRTHSVKFSDDGPDADKEVNKLLIQSHSVTSDSSFMNLIRRLFCMKADSYELIYF